MEEPSQEKKIDKGKTSPIVEDSFDFIDHCKKTKVQIYQLDYLKVNPHQLERLIQCVGKGKSWPKITINHKLGVFLEGEDNLEGTMTEKESFIVASFSKKHDPFYVSLYIDGYKLSNCINDFGASNNHMPSKVAHALGLSLNKPSRKVYSMKVQQVPLVGQLKDAQVALVAHPEKKLKLNILVADIIASYGMLLSRIFCKKLCGEIKMDMSHSLISIRDKRFNLILNLIRWSKS